MGVCVAFEMSRVSHEGVGGIQQSEFHFLIVFDICHYLDPYLLKRRPLYIEAVLHYELNEILSQHRALILEGIFLLDHRLEGLHVWDWGDPVYH